MTKLQENAIEKLIISSPLEEIIEMISSSVEFKNYTTSIRATKEFSDALVTMKSVEFDNDVYSTIEETLIENLASSDDFDAAFEEIEVVRNHISHKLEQNIYNHATAKLLFTKEIKHLKEMMIIVEHIENVK